MNEPLIAFYSLTHGKQVWWGKAMGLKSGVQGGGPGLLTNRLYIPHQVGRPLWAAVSSSEMGQGCLAQRGAAKDQAVSVCASISQSRKHYSKIKGWNCH